MMITSKLRRGAARARAPRYYLIGAMALAMGLCHAGAASAQFLCDSTVPGTADGASAPYAGSTACGHNATADGLGATAVGYNAEASGDGSTAIGYEAGFGSTGERNSFIGNSSGSNSAGSKNVALGVAAGAGRAGDGNIAIGLQAGSDPIPTFAAGDGVSGPVSNSISLGTEANARANGAVAIGAGAQATRENQFAFGTQLNTYSMAGITSDASKTAQVAPTHIVTSNATGDLAAYTPAELGLASSGDIVGLQSQIDGLGRRDNELADGIAVTLALAQPILLPGQSFAVRGGWGNFDGSNAVGVTAAGVVGRGYWGPTSAVVIDGGVGVSTQENVVAGRSGVTLGW